MVTKELIKKKLVDLNELYSPSAPIDSEKLFYGRRDQLSKIHDSVNEKGLHIVLYGERGVGKTSLANIVEQRYKNAITAKVTCNNSSSTAGIWSSIFSKIPVNYQLKKTIGFKTEAQSNHNIESITRIADLIDSKENIDIDRICTHLELLHNIKTRFLLIFDEFDQIQKQSTLRDFSNIIKYLSDNIINVTVMIVGIGSAVTDLIGQHESIERCIRQIPLEKMSEDELEEIVVNATNDLEMKIDGVVLKKIVAYSSGFAHYTHLLGKYSTREALLQRSFVIKYTHFKHAMTKSIENVNESILNLFQKAILSAKEDTLFEKVLFACALVEADEYGTFRATDLTKVFEYEYGENRKMQAFQYHLGKLCSDERGKVLEKITLGKSKTRYRIKNPLFKAYILLRYHNIKES